MSEISRSNVIRCVALVVFLAAAFSASAQSVATPNFFDQRPRTAQPVAPELARVRFLTSVDYPPFNFLDPRGRLAGFNVELAKAICEELDILDICQIEAMPFEDLLPALLRGDGDAVIAGVAVTSESREELVFTDSYFRYPARFVAPSAASLDEALAEGLRETRIGIVDGTAHQAMLQSFFPTATAVSFPAREAMLEAMKSGEVAAAFGDGVGLSFWLGSEAAAGCCAFAGGPYFSDQFLGEGLAIALRTENAALADAFNDAIARIVAEQRFSELLLRSFPISAF